MRRRHALFLGCALALLVPSAVADEIAEALRTGGVAILIRHAQTEPGIGDPPHFRLGDCSTQRNLSAAGREQSRRIGSWFAQRRVRVDEVRSSRWCRCLETAQLAFAAIPVQPFAPLDSFFDDRSREPQQTRAVIDYLRKLAPPRNVVLVTHHVNIAALTGQAVQAGEAIVVRPSKDGRLDVIGRVAFP